MTEFILSLFSSSDKLRASSLYQLLTGKRTSSVLLFGFFNGLLFAHGCFPSLKQTVFDAQIQQMIDERLLSREGNELQLTEKGRLRGSSKSLTGLHYDKYGRTAQTSWRLLKFAVQVVSHLSANETTYLPAETGPFYSYQVKKWLKETKCSRTELITRLPSELSTVFSQMTEKQANFLANQFSGKKQTGLLAYQLTTLEDAVEQQIYQDQCIHGLLVIIEQHKDFLLYDLLSTLLSQNYNQSMLTTRALILAGDPVEEVMTKRALKKGTINDHLIEWAIFFDDFPFERLIHSETRKALASLDRPLLTLKYKDLDVQTVDYGEFRLAQIERFKGGSKYGVS
ncbi:MULTISPECIES: helix-turn-helix domain-containing protein [Enterococcus]|uniref:Helicase Helix-turn-helix domain-containing protein n=1 Tax=Candidatus Enterococcus mangumiae TaxID=2230878 RepID=A0ABZ2SYK9_9ENTE|nr:MULTISPECIES: helix-turn-helix domain-containing protein [unclassified Enterococcus]MBO0491293.1 helix-turn-helix domain-containing protein [Enterococcus sp. DIV1094]MBO1301174.1 helix-turn-helix domain-containing protein [Enterococcus sp. DIV1271a]